MKKVMLVDDCLNLRDCVRNVLELRGFKVSTADNGRDALAKIAEENFDYIISDFQMPVMDGVKFLNTLREHRNETPAILWSANAEMIDRDKLAKGITVVDKGAIIETTDKIIEIMGKSIH